VFAISKAWAFGLLKPEAVPAGDCGSTAFPPAQKIQCKLKNLIETFRHLGCVSVCTLFPQVLLTSVEIGNIISGFLNSIFEFGSGEVGGR